MTSPTSHATKIFAGNHYAKPRPALDTKREAFCSPLLQLHGEVGDEEQRDKSREDHLRPRGAEVLPIHPALDGTRRPLLGCHEALTAAAVGCRVGISGTIAIR